MKWRLITLLLGAALAGCTNLKDPEFRSIDRFGLRKLDLQKATIGFSVTYYNPNSFGVTVKDAVADVYIDTLYLGKFTQDSSVEVRKVSVFSVPFTGSISLKTALNLKVEDLTNKEVLLKADGAVKVGKGGIFINKPIHYQGKHSLDFSL
jgi:LEA14-like dessication related protein